MIRIEGLKKRYRDSEIPVFDGFNEKIADGEMIFLTGCSGSGKTTLLRILLKETEPDEGEVFVGKYRLSDIPHTKIPYYRREIGVVFQDFRLFEDRTVYGNLEFVLSLTGTGKKAAEKKITSVLTMLGIDRLHKRLPRELSGGEKQKVCMARAIINNPIVLLADEPTANLDAESSEEIMRLLEIVHRQGITVILATHDYETAQNVIKHGRRINLDELNTSQEKK